MKRGYCAVPPKTSWDTIFFFEDVISPSSTVDGDSTATLNDADTSTIGYYAGWWEMLQLVVVGMLVTYALHVLYRSIRYKQRAKWSSEVDVGSGGGVPVSQRRLRRRLLRREDDPERREMLAMVFQKLELLLNARHYPMSRSLLYDFDLFDPGTDPAVYAHVGQRKVEEMEDRFLSMCQQVLSQSNFVPITKDEYDFSLREDYMSTIPIEIDWSGLDDTATRRFRLKRAAGKAIPTTTSLGFDVDSDSDEGGLGGNVLEVEGQGLLLMDKTNGLEKLDDRLWAFRRGIGVDEREDWFLFEKIDHLLVMAFTRLWNAFAHSSQNVRGFLPRTFRRNLPFLQPVPQVGNSPNGQREQVATKGAITTNMVRRVTLHDEVEAAPISCLFRKTTLREPTYKEIVMIYRRAFADSSAEPDDLSQSQSGNRRAFFIKTFRDVPMADLSMTFPEKRILLRPMDLLWFTGVVCTAAVTVLSQVEFSLLGAASLATIVLVAVRIFTTYRYSRLYYQSSMLHFLYDRSVNSHDGVLLYLIEELKNQELKEILLVYSFLVSGGPQTASQLAKATETFVEQLQAQDKRRRPLAVKIAVRDTLKKLITLDLVKPLSHTLRRSSVDSSAMSTSTRHVETRYKALEPEAAVEKLQQLWTDSFALTLPKGIAPTVVV